MDRVVRWWSLERDVGGIKSAALVAVAGFLFDYHSGCAGECGGLNASLSCALFIAFLIRGQAMWLGCADLVAVLLQPNAYNQIHQLQKRDRHYKIINTDSSLSMDIRGFFLAEN